MIGSVLLFILGLICLILGGDWFVDGAVGIAGRLRIPEVMIGATIVSIGTTLPEVMVSATSAVTGHGEIAYGNAIGSVICNTALILAISIAIRPAAACAKDIYLSSIFFFIAAVIYMVAAYFLQNFTRWIGIILLLIFVVYMAISIKKSLSVSKQHIDNPLPESNEDAEDKKKSWKDNIVVIILMLIIGAALIAVGADLLVDNGTIIAQSLGVPESVIALTFVALGTSLPELVTAITSLIKGHGSLSLGNIIGANLFNLVLVSGLSITISPFNVPAEKTIMGINSSLLIDIPLMVIVMLIAVVPVLIRNKLSRAQGIILLVLYAAFCAYQFVI